MAEKPIRVEELATGDRFEMPAGGWWDPKLYKAVSGPWDPAITGSVGPAPMIPQQMGPKAPIMGTTGEVASLVELGGSVLNATPGMVLPTAGAIAGTAAMPWVGPAGPPTGAAIGQMGNQALGITDGGWEDVLNEFAMTAAFPAVTRTLGKFKAAGPVLHELTEAKIKDLVRFAPPGPKADDLYAAVAKTGPQNIRMPKALDSLKQFTATERAQAGINLEKIPVNNFQGLRANIRKIAARVEDTREAGGAVHEKWKKTYLSSLDDMDDAVRAGNASMPGTQALKSANEAARREFASAEISGLVDPKLPGGALRFRGDLEPLSSGQLQVDINLKKLVRDIEANPHIKRAMAPDEYRMMVAELRDLDKRVPLRDLPAAAARKAPASGSAWTPEGVLSVAGKFSRRPGPLAGVAAWGLGMDPMMAATLGLAAEGAMTAAPKVLGNMLTSNLGRYMLRESLVEGRGLLSQKSLGVFGAIFGAHANPIGGAIRVGQGQPLMSPSAGGPE